jgi:OOP family OmpA-OmpF porin
MASLFFKNKSEKKPEPQPQRDDSLEELRRLLVGPIEEQFDQIRQLVNMLENQEIQVEEISQVLPEAIMMRSSRDKQIVKAMESVTEEAIEASVKKDPRVLVSILVPVMLPAIRKAITTLIKEMIQTFSATLEHGLSMRGLIWRYEAFKTKKPFGEVALLHSLVYQVEQVFLIHKSTGLVLQHIVSKESMVVPDPDMVSGMLTAIQDFVRDSFGGSQDDGLENLQFGDHSVWIEQTSLAVLAAVVWGNAPVEFKDVLRDALNAIHFEHIDHLRSFNGDTDAFESAKGHLTDCLKSQFKPKKKNAFVLWTFWGLILFFIGYWTFFSVRDYIRWTDYLEMLHKEPGIVITETDKKSGKYYVFGLRDTLAENPVELLKAAKIRPEKVKFDWELYHSSHPDFVIRRIKSILNPPDTVTFEVKNNILIAKGAASHQWIVESGKLAEAVPGIVGFQNQEVTDLDLKQIEILGEKIGNTLLFFDRVSTEIRPGQERITAELIQNIKETDRLTRLFDKSLHIEIVGHTDSVGSDERNLEISKYRAESVFSILTSEGFSAEIFTTKGVGSREPLRKEFTDEDRNFNRSVSFRVFADSEKIGGMDSPQHIGMPGEDFPQNEEQ